MLGLFGMSKFKVGKYMIEYEFYQGDFEDIKVLWRDIFKEPEAFIDFYFTQICNDNLIFTAKDGNHIIGMVHLNPYTVFSNGKKETVYYIVGVCVKEEYRFKGIMKEMIRKCLDFMKRENVSFTFLMPKDEAYYKGLGFRNIYSNLDIKYYDIDNICTDEKFSMRDASFYTDAELELFGKRLNELIQDEYSFFVNRDMACLKKLIDEHRCQNGSVMEMFFWGNTIGYFSFDIYEDLTGTYNMYVERFFVKDGYVLEALEIIKQKGKEENCSVINVTVPYNKSSDIKWRNLIVEKDNVKLFKGKGIMAYCIDEQKNVKNMQKKSFFDEIV